MDRCSSPTAGFSSCEVRPSGLADRRSDSSALDISPQFVCAVEEQIFVGLCLGFQLEIKQALVSNFTSPEIVGDQGNRKPVVPFGTDPLLNADDFIPVLLQLNLTRAMVGIWNGDRGIADRLFVN